MVNYTTIEDIVRIGQRDGGFVIREHLPSPIKRALKEQIASLFKEKVFNRVPIRTHEGLFFRFVPPERRVKFVQRDRPKPPKRIDVIGMLENGDLTIDMSKSDLRKKQLFTVLQDLRSDKMVSRKKLGFEKYSFTLSLKPKVENVVEELRDVYRQFRKTFSDYQLTLRMNEVLVEQGFPEASQESLEGLLKGSVNAEKMLEDLLLPSQKKESSKSPTPETKSVADNRPSPSRSP